MFLGVSGYYQGSIRFDPAFYCYRWYQVLKVLETKMMLTLGEHQFIDFTKIFVRFFPGTSDRMVCFSGMMHQIDAVIPVVLQLLLEGTGMPREKMTVLLVMPTSGIKYIVGKNGDIVKEINRRSGTFKVMVRLILFLVRRTFLGGSVIPDDFQL
jgi:hypothetical protein